MLNFFATVRRRHSIRHYQPDMAVGEAELTAILETAVAAPSAGDLQAYRIVVVRDPALRADLAVAAGDQAFIAEAPVCLVFCTDAARSAARFGPRGADLFALQDATIAAAYAQLATVATDLGSTWVGQFDEAKVNALLQLGPALRAVALLCIGYPAEEPALTTRRRLDEVVIWH